MLALVSTGWGPGCLSQAGVALINEVYRVETFGLDPQTRAQISQLHTMCHHAPPHNDWHDDAIVDAAARALRLAQSDERAAFVTPSGPLSTAIWPLLHQAAAELAMPVRVAHGLGLAESLANCLHLPLAPIAEIRPTLADFVGETRMPQLAVATDIGDTQQVSTLFDGQMRVFRVDLFARHVQQITLDSHPLPTPNQLFIVASTHITPEAHARHTHDISTLVADTADWVELLNNVTEALRG